LQKNLIQQKEIQTLQKEKEGISAINNELKIKLIKVKQYIHKRSEERQTHLQPIEAPPHVELPEEVNVPVVEIPLVEPEGNTIFVPQEPVVPQVIVDQPEKIDNKNKVEENQPVIIEGDQSESAARVRYFVPSPKNAERKVNIQGQAQGPNKVVPPVKLKRATTTADETTPKKKKTEDSTTEDEK